MIGDSGSSRPMKHVDAEIRDHDVEVDFRQLRSFAFVARTGSFSAAAQAAGYTQSAVSQHVAALEASLGHQLLERRPVRLTAAGTQLLRHADAILLRLDAAQTELRPRADGRPVTVALTTLARPGLAAVGARSVRATPAGEALRAVARGDVDVALVDGFGSAGDPLLLVDAGALETRLVRETDAVVLLDAGHPLARGRRVQLGQLADARWIDAPHVAAPLAELRRLAGEPDGYRARASYDGHDLQTLLDLVGAGLGAAVTPALGDALPASVVERPVGQPPLVHRIEAVRLRGSQLPGSQLPG
jgi:DNA-binding transcriptional LysR family regulator